MMRSTSLRTIAAAAATSSSSAASSPDQTKSTSPSVAATLYRSMLKRVVQLDEHYKGDAPLVWCSTFGRLWDTNTVERVLRPNAETCGWLEKGRSEDCEATMEGSDALRRWAPLVRRFIQPQSDVEEVSSPVPDASGVALAFAVLRSANDAIMTPAMLGRYKFDTAEVLMANKTGGPRAPKTLKVCVPLDGKSPPMPAMLVPSEPFFPTHVERLHKGVGMTRLWAVWEAAAIEGDERAASKEAASKFVVGSKDKPVAPEGVLPLFDSSSLAAADPLCFMPPTRDSALVAVSKLPTKTTTRTDDIEVEVKTTYLGPIQAGPFSTQEEEDGDKFAFEYSIAIRNLAEAGGPQYCLASRHWHFVDVNDETVHEVCGPGVVGNFPTLDPGDSFVYSSGTRVVHKEGCYMKGTFQFMRSLEEKKDSAEASGAESTDPNPTPSEQAASSGSKKASLENMERIDAIIAATRL